MRPLGEFSKVFLHKQPVDMRKGLLGLINLAVIDSQEDLQSALFVFIGKRKDTIKAVYIDKNGMCLWVKKLSEYRFDWPKEEDDAVELTPEQFQWLLSGINVWKMKKFQENSKISYFF
jgi:transposase